MRVKIRTLIKDALAVPVAWGSIKQGTETPYVVLHRLSLVGNRHLAGRGLMRARVQADCYGKTLDEADQLSQAVREALDGYQGDNIDGVFHAAERDNREAGPEVLFRISQDFAVIYRE